MARRIAAAKIRQDLHRLAYGFPRELASGQIGQLGYIKQRSAQVARWPISLQRRPSAGDRRGQSRRRPGRPGAGFMTD